MNISNNTTHRVTAQGKRVVEFLYVTYKNLDADNKINPAYFEYMAAILFFSYGDSLNTIITKAKRIELNSQKTLSTLFSHAVNTQQGINPHLNMHLLDVELTDNHTWIVPNFLKDSSMDWVAKILSISAGQVISDAKHLDRALSALLACRLLSGTLDNSIVQKVVSLIITEA